MWLYGVLEVGGRFLVLHYAVDELVDLILERVMCYFCCVQHYSRYRDPVVLAWELQ